MDKYFPPRYAVYPSVKMYDFPDGYVTDENRDKLEVSKFTFKKQLLFGDFIQPIDKDGHYDRITIKS